MSRSLKEIVSWLKDRHVQPKIEEEEEEKESVLPTWKVPTDTDQFKDISVRLKGKMTTTSSYLL